MEATPSILISEEVCRICEVGLWELYAQMYLIWQGNDIVVGIYL